MGGGKGCLLTTRLEAVFITLYYYRGFPSIPSVLMIVDCKYFSIFNHTVVYNYIIIIIIIVHLIYFKSDTTHVSLTSNLKK